LPSSETVDRLAERCYVTVVIRVLVDGRGQLVHAEVVAPARAEARRAGQWRELARLVRASVDEARAGRR
jgi:hypothetical protein